MPGLSVLLPVRNGEGTIGRAVSSTLRALPRDSELVVFDDGSVDGTRAVLDAVADRRLTVLTSGEVSGVPGALNLMIARTDSRLIARMDADDVTLPWRFARQQRMLDRECRVAFTTVIEWYPARRRLSPNLPRAISSRAFPFHLLLSNPVAHPTMMAERSALAEVGGYRSVPAEDYDLWMRLQAVGVPLACAAVPGLLYRMHADQVTASTEWRNSSWADPATAHSFGELSRRVLGQTFPRLVTLASREGVDEADFAAITADFEDEFRRAADALRRVERALVLRKLESRLRAVRATFRERADRTGA